MSKAEQDKIYHRENIKGVYIPFNVHNPSDVLLMKWVSCYPNKTKYIKDLIRRDMALQGGLN